MRYYLGAERYKQTTLAKADDLLPADGTEFLSFEQASRAAKDYVGRQIKERLAAVAGPLLTVEVAINEYLQMREIRENAIHGGSTGTKRDARSRLRKHVLSSDLARRLLLDLEVEHFVKWRQQLSGLAPQSIKRLINDLKAALNFAVRNHRKQVAADFERVVRDGLKIDEPNISQGRQQILTPDQLLKIIVSAAKIDKAQSLHGDLHRMVVVMAATGARFSQIRRMVVSSVQPERKRLMMPKSRKGANKAVQIYPISITQDVIECLFPVTKGRSPDEPLLEHWIRKQTGFGKWVNSARGAWKNPSEMDGEWKAIVADAGLPDGTIPYALRHTSIHRMITANMPIRTVAALHDNSVAMIEKNYTAFITDHIDQMAADIAVQLIYPDQSG